MSVFSFPLETTKVFLILNDINKQTHRLDTEPLAALPPLSLPFRAAVDEAAAAAGSMFWEAMSADVAVTAKETGRTLSDKDADSRRTDCGHCKFKTSG